MHGESLQLVVVNEGELNVRSRAVGLVSGDGQATAVCVRASSIRLTQSDYHSLS